MAKQTGPNPFTGRRGDLLGYRIGKQYYVRVISSLTAERVLSDPAFKLTMQYAGLLGKASKIASAIYRLLPEQEHGFYRRLTGMAMQLLKQGRTGEEAFEQLYNDFIFPEFSVEVPKQERVSNTQFPGIVFPSQVEASPKGRVPNYDYLSNCGDFQVEAPQKDRVPNSKKLSEYKRQLVETPSEKRVSNSSFPDELLRRVFSKPPAGQETERASVADHPPRKNHQRISLIVIPCGR